jgi:hypothetical protein
MRRPLDVLPARHCPGILKTRPWRGAWSAVAALLLLAPLLQAPSAWAARDLPRYFPQMRPLLMGDAYVAVGDEASTAFYNPAGIANLPATTTEINLPLPSLVLGPVFRDALADPDNVSKRYQNLNSSDFRDLLGTHLFSDVTLRLPFVTLSQRGVAWGFGVDVLVNVDIQGNPVLPALHLEAHADALLFVTIAGQPNENLSLGITPKLIDRIGIDKVFTFGELYATGSTLDLNNQPDYKKFKNGTTYTAGGVDLGFIYRFAPRGNWDPRIGAAMLNVGGYDQDQGLRGIQFGRRPTPFDPPIGGELPQINSIGFALSPSWYGIRYTLAFDVVDVTRTVLPGNDWLKRTRLGAEVGIGIKEDGTALFSILGGYNATHPAFGFLSRVWIFEVGLGTYEVELGEKPGDQPEKRTVFTFSLHI